MELQTALTQVSEIHRQMAQSGLFRGYRAVPAALSALIAVVTAAAQPFVVENPREEPGLYLALWVGAALVSALITAGVTVVRCVKSASPLATRQMLLATEQFLPCTIAGGALTVVLGVTGGDNLWILPGLWGVIFSLGLFATSRLLPRAIFWVALYYLATGLATLAYARGDSAFAPWSMAVMFGGGQLLTAIVLYLTLERQHVAE
jgi:hypothetical protein